MLLFFDDSFLLFFWSEPYLFLLNKQQSLKWFCKGRQLTGHLNGKCLSSWAKMSNGLILTASVSVYWDISRKVKLTNCP